MPLQHRADTELRATGDRVRSPGPALPSLRDLSSQQLQVVLVVAAGATNKEAAASLFLSPKTVDYHLRNACALLGVRNRTELGVAVERMTRP